MKRDDMNAGTDCAVRAGVAIVAHAWSQIAMLGSPGAIVRAAFVSD